MMYKKVISLIILILLIFNCQSIKAMENKNQDKVLIVYDYKEFINSDLNIIDYLNEIIINFKFDVSIVQANELADNDLNKYNYIIAVFNKEEKLNEHFIKNIKEYKGEIFWIGNNVEEYLNENKKFNFTISKITYDLKLLKLNGNNRGKVFYIDNKANITSIINDELDVKSYLSNGMSDIPFVCNKNNFWYECMIPYNKALLYETINELMSFLNISDNSENNIILKMEITDVDLDTKEISNIVNFFENEQVPYIISLKEGEIINTEKKIQEILKYAQNKSGTIILQDKDDIKNQVAICLNNEIYPLGVESNSFYIKDSVKGHFSTIFQSSSEDDILRLPYIIKDNKNFNLFIPNNSGVINTDNNMWKRKIQKDLEELNIIGGYTYTLNIPITMDIRYLEELMNYLKSENFKFLNIKQYNNWINWDDISVKSSKNHIEVSYDKNIATNSKKNITYIQKINGVLVIIVGLFTLIFLIVFLYFKNINKRKFLR